MASPGSLCDGGDQRLQLGNFCFNTSPPCTATRSLELQLLLQEVLLAVQLLAEGDFSQLVAHSPS